MVALQESDGGTKKKTAKALEKTRKRFKKGKEVEAKLDRVWQKVERAAINYCPVKYGDLKRTIRIVKIPVGQMSGAWSRVKELTIFDRSIIAGDITKMNTMGKPINYATWVHDGHRMRNGRMWAGVPFLTMALAQYDSEINKAIDEALKEIGKKMESDK